MAISETAGGKRMAAASAATAATPAQVIADDRPYVDWCAILAGVAMATAITLLFFAFGSAVGLSFASPYDGAETSVTAIVIATGLWILWVQVTGLLVGGYFAGRLRRRIGDGDRNEANMRDGAHGLAVWAMSVIISAILTATAVSGALGLGASALNAAGQQAADWAYEADTLLRAAPAPADGAAPATGTSAQGTNDQARGEIGRILAKNVVMQDFNADDRAYAVRLISQSTGLNEQDAGARLDAVVSQARATADSARKHAILLAFLTTAALLVGAIAAWWAATVGGDHRDEGTDFSALTRWR